MINTLASCHWVQYKGPHPPPWLPSASHSTRNTISAMTTEYLITTESVYYTGYSEILIRYLELSELIWKVGSPILLTVGTVGNLLTIIVLLQSSQMKKSSTSIYLIVLAIVDTLLLYIGLLRNYQSNVHYKDFRNSSVASCKLLIFGIYFGVQLEAWILVNLTLERFTAVLLPLKVKMYFSKARVFIGLTITAVSLFLLNFHFIWYWGLNLMTGSCQNLGNHNFYEKQWPWIDLTVSSLLPFLILLALNCIIILRITCKGSSVATAPRGRSTRITSMTAILISVSFTFLLFTLPICIYLCLSGTFAKVTDEKDIGQQILAWAVVSLLYYTNTSCNFILYCISGPKFRKEFLAMLQRNRIFPIESRTTEMNTIATS